MNKKNKFLFTTKIMSSNISGFPELPLNYQIVFELIKAQIIQAYELYGFSPLETRLVEDIEMLKEKGIDGKELFVLSNFGHGEVKEKGENQLVPALRFDLTVPCARFVGQNYKTMQFPYKRWQIQKVYRGETARESLGRFCEFYQFDIDVIGKGELNLVYDAEFPCVIYEIFRKVFGIERFVVRINNRRLLEGMFQEFGMTDGSKLRKAVKVIDNMEKVPIEETTAELTKLDLSEESAQKVLSFFNVCRNSRPSEVVAAFGKMTVTNELFKQGLTELTAVINAIVSNGVPEEYFMVDPSVARGLGYYTGTVYETTLLDFKHLGSVCSGGRYDDLVGTLSGDKNLKFPGCGISIGLSRLLPTLIENGVILAETTTTAQVLIAVQDEKRINTYNEIATKLRTKGVNTVVNYAGGRLKTQIELAGKGGYKFMLIGREELDEGKIQLKIMNSGKENVLMNINDAIDEIVKNITKVNYKTTSQPNNRQFLGLSEEELLRCFNFA